MSTPPLGQTLVGADGVFHRDLPCRRCGYNLRGLMQTGRCPECGTPIGLSAFGDLLRFADPRWLAKLAAGVSYIMWGIVVAIAVGGVGAVLSALVHPTLGQLLMTCASGLSLYGMWLLTAPDPSGIGEDKDVSARRLVRICLLAGLGYSVVQAAWPAFMVPSTGTMSRLLPLIGIVLMLLLGFCQAVGEAAKMTYLARLARRIPDDRFVSRARMLAWCNGSVTGLMTIGAVGLLVLGMTFAGTGPMVKPTGPVGFNVTMSGSAGTAGAGAGGLIVLGCATAVVGLAALVFGIMSLLLIWRMGKAFREHGAYATAIWAQQPSVLESPAQPA